MNFKTLNVAGFEGALQGMRAPYKSYDKSDSFYSLNLNSYVIGDKDYELAKKLWLAGTEHRKWLRMIQVQVQITAPRFFWSEWDTYKIGTASNSESTMHKLKDEELSKNSFDFDWQFDEECSEIFNDYLNKLKKVQKKIEQSSNTEFKKKYFIMLKQMLPEGFLQTRVICLNYEVLAAMYHQRQSHRLPHWSKDFVSWIDTLPYSEFITGKFDFK